jgi:site-specific DNA-methyltransferase (adenine-specific)
MTMRVERIGNAVLYLADCRAVLPTLHGIDAVVTDPPFGIEGSSGSKNIERGKCNYTDAFEDSREYVKQVCVPAVEAALALCNGRGAVTPGTPCLWLYPEPAALGGFHQPATVGLNRWGRANFGPVCFYGKDPRAGKRISDTVLKVIEPASDDRHPCAKPIRAMQWIVDRVSLEGESILDPFMGSGTTGVACANLGRSFVGIELEPKYFEIAVERIRAAQAQIRLFA